MANRLKKLIRELFGDGLEIQHKLLNLILLAAFLGGIVSLIVSIAIGSDMEAANLTIGLLVAMVGLGLWIANKKHKPQVAALMVVVSANMFLFPIMYFSSGGMDSGMPVWLVLGMIFSWLILKGRLCFIMYALNVLVVVGCFLLELYWPELVTQMDDRTAIFVDMIQSIIVVTCIFGAIFKYQTHVYEKQKKQLVKANQAKSEFLANMSHEVRTPINAILGYNEMIMKESRESHTMEYALNVQTAGRNLLSLVSDILDFTNIERGQLILRKSEYSIVELLQDILSHAEHTAARKNLELRLSIDETIPKSLYGDATRMGQILENLITNALKYTKEGYVELALGWEKISDGQGFLEAHIRDTGIGMADEDVRKISESFVRFDNQHTRNIQGVGLGLTIVTRLLHAMESKLQVESEIGKGSCFSFRVKQEVAEETPIGKYERIQTPNLSEHMAEKLFEAPGARILAVDDNLTNLDLLKGILKRTKVELDVATNGEEALELVRKGQYHMILMDHMMPVMDGVEALHKMREEGLCNGVPVLVLTANAVGDARERYLREGFDDYLAKPIMGSQLLAAIKKYLPAEALAGEEQGFLDGLSFLDTNLGMQYCCENEDFYREMLGSYLANSKLEALQKNYREEKWEDYRIQVHALKSTSLSIGAVPLSENAKALEMAVKESRIAYVRENHEAVMAEYEKLLGMLRRELERPVAVVETVANAAEEKEHILVVDDEPMNLKIAERLLGEVFRVSCVKSGQEALEFLQKNIPNLVLLDLHMPEMNGFEVMRRIKEKQELKEIPVVFLTADNDRETEIKGFREGALDFITKPFVADIMLQRIKRILELDRLQKDLQLEVSKQTQKAEARREKVERLSMQIMLTLANTIDAKDKYTNGHSVRVAEYAREIAKRAGKSEQEQEDIYYIGLLHDIGKIGIPNTIINKTSRLTDEEYEIIKTHPKIGAEILESMTEIPGLPIGAHWHHERYDGTGYPEGLKGEEIPEIARIIGVADAYDAMASKRSYRDVLPQSVIKEEIIKGKGKQFDPYLADIMLELIDEDEEYQMRERTI